MVTVYDLLEVSEKASKREIEESYKKLVLEYKVSTSLSEKENKENELILKKLKLAYDILSDDEKRRQYDKDLSQKRAEELIKNVKVKNEIPQNMESNISKKENTDEKESLNEEHLQYNNELENEQDDIELTEEELKRVKKEAKKNFKQNLKRAQKAEEEYNRVYAEEYNKYLRKLGYNVKEPWTLERVKRTVLTILVIVVIFALIWLIPISRNFLINIYENNVIIKALVDIVIALFEAIFSVIH